MSNQKTASKAVEECLIEMYRLAVPSIDLRAAMANIKEIEKNQPLYEQHYLSMDNYSRIQDEYKAKYKLDKYYTAAFHFKTMNYSPCSNPRTVADFWKDQYSDMDKAIFPWAAVDKDGTEAIFREFPKLDANGKWNDESESRVEVPKGSIKYWMDEKLSFEDKPIQLTLI